MTLTLLSLALSTGCAHRHALSMEDTLAWDVHPRMVEGDIRVVPAVIVSPQVEPITTDMLGEQLDPWLLEGRNQRAEQLDGLPEALRASVPGALYAALPPGWDGWFRDSELPLPQRRALARAVVGEGSMEAALAAAARATGGDATLVIWVVENEGQPLTAHNMVGELVMSCDTPVMVDFDNEPYEVNARVGMALVAADGELLFRYEDDYAGLLTEHSPVRLLARDMARSLVSDITPMWLEAFDEDDSTSVAGL
ncbi:MAG: hypothetical protein H6739_39255 [Alphaproteobacteria bacterium]|nr:hypothetical protein [Alphaproteobacteria bacterium]